MNRLLIYTDESGFGGHEVTLLSALEALTQSGKYRVTVLFNRTNRRLQNEFEKIQARHTGVELIGIDPGPSRLETTQAVLGIGKVARIRSEMEKVKPDAVLVSQGAIARSACGLAAGRQLGIPVISFIPNVYKAAWILNSSGLSARLQDFLNRYVYRLPTGFITIDESVKERLVRDHGVSSSSVQIAHYGLDPAKYRRLDKAKARKDLGIGAEWAVGTIGRMDFSQKGQDFLILAVNQHRNALDGMVFLLIGDGPDAEKAGEMVKRFQLESRIRFIHWQDDLSLVYSALDALLLPSRAEGLPIVLFEAMLYELPITASNIDGVHRMLPPSWLFDLGDASGMVECLNRMRRSPDGKLLSQHREMVLSSRTAQRFGDEFVSAVDAFLPGG